MNRLIAIGIMLSTISAASAGTVTVDILNWDDGDLCDGGFAHNTYAAGVPITVSYAPCVRRINIFADSSTDIGPITLSGPAPVYTFEIVIGSIPLKTDDSQYVIAGRNFAGLTGPSSALSKARFGGRIGGNLTGSIDVGALYRFDVDGMISASIHSRSSLQGNGQFIVVCGGASSSATVSRKSGDIRLVDCAGNFAGLIDVEEGNLNSLVVHGDFTGIVEVDDANPNDQNVVGTLTSAAVTGSLGTASDPAFVGVRALLQTVTAGEINATFTGPNGRPRMGSLHRVTTTGAGVTTGRLAGLLQTAVIAELNPSTDGFISLAGPLEGRVEVSRGLLLNQFSVAVPANGLQGQLLLNVENGSGVNNVWTGPITVGSTTLAPNYSSTAASLGGGTAGIVRFNLHGTDSVPLDGASVPFDSARPGPGNPIRIRL